MIGQDMKHAWNRFSLKVLIDIPGEKQLALRSACRKECIITSYLRYIGWDCEP
jgi:hypothetical protein